MAYDIIIFVQKLCMLSLDDLVVLVVYICYYVRKLFAIKFIKYKN
jgi:hypothetical protein